KLFFGSLSMSDKLRLAITGATGNIGSAYRKHVGDRYDVRLMDIRPVPDADGEDTVVGDLADPAVAVATCKGMDVVLHLAADPRVYAEFYADLIDANFKAVYNIYRAAKDEGVKRVIFASSVNSVLGYPSSHQVRPEDAPCPKNVYGASKAFGESLGAYFAAEEGLEVIAVRIGGFGPVSGINKDTTYLWNSFFVSDRDLCHLFDRCIVTPNITFAIAHGISNNRYCGLDITDTCKLFDYHPQDDGYAITDADAKAHAEATKGS
ncbi:MAG: NAD(P)-dependent oxidoreductase, partial [Chthonomonadales bacterium]